jgi:hypothetical protein
MPETVKAALRRCAMGAAATVLVLLAALAAAGSARALDIKVTANVRPGPFTLDGVTDVTSPFDRSRGLRRVVVTVTDARGSGAGWRLDLRIVNGPVDGIAVVGIDVRCGKRSTCTLPRTLVGFPSELALNRRTTVVEGRQGTGMGRVDVTLTIAAKPAGGRPELRFSLAAV